MRHFAPVGLAILLAAPAFGGKVIVRNHTDEAFTLESRSWTDMDGDEQEDHLRWEISPKEETHLKSDDAAIEATRFSYKVIQNDLNRDDVETCDEESEELVVDIWSNQIPKPVVAKKLHVLFAMDSDADDIGDSVEKDKDRLFEVIGEIQKGREDKIEWIQFTGPGLTAEAVLGFYRDRTFEQDTALLFVYSGHGGLGDDGFPFMALKHGRALRRGELYSAMQGTGAVLQVIVSDACSNFADVEPPNRRVPAEWEVFKSLFFQSRGLVDLTATQDYTFAWGNAEHGGYFIHSFTHFLCEPVWRTDDNDDGLVSWDEFFEDVRDQTNATFQEARDNAAEGDPIREFTDQVPKALYLGNTQMHLEYEGDGKGKFDGAIAFWKSVERNGETLMRLGKLIRSSGAADGVAREWDKQAHNCSVAAAKFGGALSDYRLAATIAYAQQDYEAYKRLNKKVENAAAWKRNIETSTANCKTNAALSRALAKQYR